MRTPVFVLFFTLYLMAPGQNVTAMLTARYNGNPLLLDTIVLENLTRPCQKALSPLPQITSYQIDLNQGKIINSIGEQESGYGIFMVRNTPGLSQFKVLLPGEETLKFTLLDVSGKQIFVHPVLCKSGLTFIDVSPGKGPLFILWIQGKDFRSSFKIVGGSQDNPGVRISNTGNHLTKSSFTGVESQGLVRGEFIYSPGDKVQCTAIKNGMYSNLTISYPVDKDSINIILSAPCSSGATVYDYDGNLYHTVQIGSQCWMRENMRSTHYADGVALVDGTGAGDISNDYTTKYWFDYGDDPANSLVYGKLYTGAGAMNGQVGFDEDSVRIQGICPNGWHVASDGEWMRLEAYLGMGGDTISMMKYRGTDQGLKLKAAGNAHWGGYNDFSTNESGFNAFAGGYRISSGQFDNLSGIGEWRTSRSFGSLVVRMMSNIYSQIYRGIGYNDNGLSCRCIRD